MSVEQVYIVPGWCPPVAAQAFAWTDAPQSAPMPADAPAPAQAPALACDNPHAQQDVKLITSPDEVAKRRAQAAERQRRYRARVRCHAVTPSGSVTNPVTSVTDRRDSVTGDAGGVGGGCLSDQPASTESTSMKAVASVTQGSLSPRHAVTRDVTLPEIDDPSELIEQIVAAYPAFPRTRAPANARLVGAALRYAQMVDPEHPPLVSIAREVLTRVQAWASSALVAGFSDGCVPGWKAWVRDQGLRGPIPADWTTAPASGPKRGRTPEELRQA